MKTRSELIKTIIAIVKDTPGVTLNDLKELLPSDNGSVSQTLSHMIRRGYVRREGERGYGRLGVGYKYYPVDSKSNTPPINKHNALIIRPNQSLSLTIPHVNFLRS